MYMHNHEIQDARRKADKTCRACAGEGTIWVHDDVGLMCLPGFSYQDRCGCTDKVAEKFEFDLGCKLCLGEGLIRGIDFGAGSGDREFVWDICDCSAGQQFQPESSNHYQPDPNFEF